MTDEEMKRLEELAKGATPGPWDHDGFVEPEKVRSTDGTVARTAVLGDWDNGTPQQEKDAAYIAAAHPAVVLALIERVRKAEARAERGGEAKLQPALDIIREPLLEMGCTFPGGGIIGIAEGIREVLRKAERKGAEEMREAAAQWVLGCPSVDALGHGFAADSIRALPLPGDAP